jgi:fumarylacetoacetase
MASWVNISQGSDFSLYNLPYGVFSTAQLSPRIGVAIGEHVLDLKALCSAGVFDHLNIRASALQQPSLNEYANQGHVVHRKVRELLQELLKQDTRSPDVLRDNEDLRARALLAMDQVTMHLPMVIGDYTDHFVGLPHAKTVSDFGCPAATAFSDQ